MEPKNAYDKPIRFFTEDNALLVIGMFLELDDANEAWRQFTLQTWDTTYKGHVYRSLHRLYVEHNDPGEHDFASEYFYNYAHWDRVKSHPAIKPHYDVMRAELEASITSQATRAMVNNMRSGTATQATLAYLADKKYLPPSSSSPSSSPSSSSPSSSSPSSSHSPVEDDLARIKATH